MASTQHTQPHICKATKKERFPLCRSYLLVTLDRVRSSPRSLVCLSHPWAIRATGHTHDGESEVLGIWPSSEWEDGDPEVAIEELAGRGLEHARFVMSLSEDCNPVGWASRLSGSQSLNSLQLLVRQSVSMIKRCERKRLFDAAQTVAAACTLTTALKSLDRMKAMGFEASAPVLMETWLEALAQQRHFYALSLADRRAVRRAELAAAPR